MKYKNFVKAIIIGCLLLGAQTSFAIILEGSSSGIFTNPIGPEDMLTAGVGTNSFSWGEQVEFGQSNLTYTGNTFMAETGSQFSLGTLNYFNGTILSGTEADSAQFVTNISFNQPNLGNKSFTFDLNLVNTLNSENNTPAENADLVFLPNLFANEVFEIDGMLYTLKLMFGNVDENGFSEIDKFFVFEGNSASAQLLGTITADFPIPVPVPAALPLFLSAITGLCLVGRRKSSRSL